MTRYYDRARVVGPISWELRFVRAGLADVVVLDEQCIRTDIYDEAAKVNAPVIAASEKNCMGFKNRTNDPADEIVADLVSGKVKGVLILDPEKVGEVAVRVAQKVAPIRKRKNVLPSMEEITQIAKTCTQCKSCQRNCPQDYAIPAAMKAAARGDISLLEDLYETWHWMWEDVKKHAHRKS